MEKRLDEVAITRYYFNLVVTPTSKELFFWALAVFIFVLFLMALVTGMDFGLGKLTLWIFG